MIFPLCQVEWWWTTPLGTFSLLVKPRVLSAATAIPIITTTGSYTRLITKAPPQRAVQLPQCLHPLVARQRPRSPAVARRLPRSPAVQLCRQPARFLRPPQEAWQARLPPQEPWLSSWQSVGIYRTTINKQFPRASVSVFLRIFPESVAKGFFQRTGS